MGANQSTVGTLKNRALINLCLATGQIGRPGSGPLSLTGQPNAMGGREVTPEEAAPYVRLMATGRSDYPNQINNVLAFPGIFRGAIDVRARAITEGMKLAAADALAGIVADDVREDYIIPSPFDPRVGPAVAAAVSEAARRDGVARR